MTVNVCVCIEGEAGKRIWSEWGPCSTTCGTGVRSRVRSPCIYFVSLPDCTVDYETQQMKLCSLQDCPCKLSILIYLFIKLYVGPRDVVLGLNS